MRTAPFSLTVLLALLSSALHGQEIPADKAQQIRDACPALPRVTPKKPRKALIFNTPSFVTKDPHKGYCSPYGAAAMKSLGEKTRAFEPVASNDQWLLMPENLKQFDVIIFNNTAGEWATPGDELMKKLDRTDVKAAQSELRQGILDWVKAGGGVVAYHFALGAIRTWPEFNELFGGKNGGHAWDREMAFQIEEPEHPLVAAFGGKGFRQSEETFQFAAPWSRDKVRVLISIDNEASDVGRTAPGYRLRDDRDFAIAWVKTYGKGRVFYTSFGHRTEIYFKPVFLQFYLDGIQFAAGDLDCPTEPRPGKPTNVARAPK